MRSFFAAAAVATLTALAVPAPAGAMPFDLPHLSFPTPGADGATRACQAPATTRPAVACTLSAG